MDVVKVWTGRLAQAMQKALRLTNEAFARELDVGVRTVASWREKPDMELAAETQQLLDIVLERATPAVKARFAQLIGADVATPMPDDSSAADAEQRISNDPHIGAALEWLDRNANWTPGASRQKVASRLAAMDMRELQNRGNRRGRVDQRQLALSLASYYSDRPDGFGTYRASYGDGLEAVTSVLTRADWLDLDCALAPETDQLTLTGTPSAAVLLDDSAAAQAVQRLTETLAAGVRLVDAPLYRLLGIDVEQGKVGGAVGLVSFVEYALTMDLLESELTDALATSRSVQQGDLPLRDRYLPDAASVVDVSGRLCVGGALALCAVARPAMYGSSDYLLLLQERSGRVLNAARRLAVVPKAFHQPMVDYRMDARIRSTLMREMEEELFGREEIDNTAVEQRTFDPMHPSRLTEPMRWLTEQDGRLRIECTGFGLNLVSGNYECASLIVIEDEQFWSMFGGHIEANWEAGNLRRYSSLDRELLTDLIADVAWNNEGLFAFLQGLRRLAAIDGDRVNLPPIEWELR